MTVKIREWRRGQNKGYEVDIRFTYPDGTPFRQRIKAPVESRSAAKRWGEARERELLMGPSPAFLRKQQEQHKEVPTLKDFGSRFVEGYARANRQKASSIATKERILSRHLVPELGAKRLDQITNEDIQRLKGKLQVMSTKTVNNILNVLSKLLNVAVEWGVLDRRPCSIKLLKTVAPVMAFYEPDQYCRLVEAARKLGGRLLAMVLLGGDAGLRRGEMIALRQTDVDFNRHQLHVQRAVWCGVEDVPKGGRGRIVPMTNALEEALGANRHLRGPRVLYEQGGGDVDENVLQEWMEQVTRRAGLEVTRSLHILRHTFCSRLAMKGAPVKAIQELAGHQSLTTTMRYMHLSPAAREGAIRLLDQKEGRTFGEIVETAVANPANA